MVEKFICINNAHEVDSYLDDGWSIKAISAWATNGVKGCYIHLIKENSENC